MVVGSSNNDALLIFVSFYNKLVSQWTVIFYILALNVKLGQARPLVADLIFFLQ